MAEKMTAKAIADRNRFAENLERHSKLARFSYVLPGNPKLGLVDSQSLEGTLTQLEDAVCFFDATARLIEDARQILIKAAAGQD